jgi:hypothetical protein
MTIYKFPPDSSENDYINKSNEEREDKKIRKPEFIIIEDDNSREDGIFSGPASAQLFDSLKKLRKMKTPWFLRVCTIIVSASSLIIASSLACILIVSLLLSFICLRQWKHLNFLIEKGWMVCKYLLVTSLGTFIATLYPSFGFGTILLYFLMIGQGLDSNLMKRFMKMQNPSN